ncbi:hypothetical protein [Rhodoplanes sp. Z2-YC6860]|uniref:hypothetical protein n=1 Tax=Rhodoplanes sp. Z2-YC6860 TaxID=674703 RepID=UPI00082FF5C6|nr:hypothetical protein [Rhodoplanes sp. Z2-YC6860]
MTALIKAHLALLVLLAGSVSVGAAEIRVGDTVTVKPNSIWFQDIAMLTHWQKLRKRGHAAALTSYQEQKLRNRDAWQFLYPMSVKIVGHTPKAHQVSVEMLTEGRMQGTHWVLDSRTLMQKREVRP